MIFPAIYLKSRMNKVTFYETNGLQGEYPWEEKTPDP